tara:strand:- start:292 stop:735 length:444 start_codon:yes stop_codon:yes gene_type:complete
MKTKSLFDHITHITQRQTKNYFEDINDADRKTWSNYMVNRFLSMNSNWTDLVNEIQKYKLKPKDLYRLYIEILPKSKQWLRYTKGKKTMKYQRWLLEIVAKYYESSLNEAHDYLEIYYSTEQGKAELKSILQKYGVEPKEIKKLNLP